MVGDPQLGLVAHGEMRVKYRRISKKHETIAIERKRRSVVFDHGSIYHFFCFAEMGEIPQLFFSPQSRPTIISRPPVRLIEFQISATTATNTKHRESHCGPLREATYNSYTTHRFFLLLLLLLFPSSLIV